MTHRYGWRKDAHDDRDYRLAAVPAGAVRLPPSVDLRADFPPAWDQGELQSCVGHAVAAALAYARGMQGLPAFVPSRLMIYYGARTLDGTVGSDAGCQIRNGIKAAARWGACPEEIWPYDPARVAEAPSDEAFTAALTDRAIGYRRVPQDLGTLRATLAAGDPIVFGLAVMVSLESDEVARTGTVPMPAPGEAWIGKHAVVCVGYDDQAGRFLVRNSWGAWGQGGYFTLPYSYMADPNLTADHWTIRLVTPAAAG